MSNLQQLAFAMMDAIQKQIDMVETIIQQTIILSSMLQRTQFRHKKKHVSKIKARKSRGIVKKKNQLMKGGSMPAPLKS